MFENFTKKLVKTAVNEAKETVEEKVVDSFDKYFPIITTGICIGIAILSIYKGVKVSSQPTSITIVNNHYYF
jgi:hypothetical protein